MTEIKNPLLLWQILIQHFNPLLKSLNRNNKARKDGVATQQKSGSKEDHFGETKVFELFFQVFELKLLICLKWSSPYWFINRCRTSQIEEELTKRAISKETTLRNRDFWALIPVLTKICFKIYIFKTKNFCNDLCKMRLTQKVKKTPEITYLVWQVKIQSKNSHSLLIWW